MQGLISRTKMRCVDTHPTSITYDNPNMRDEECTYTFNKDGSASCVSHAWGTKTELPKGSFIDNGKAAPEKMVEDYKAYYNYCMLQGKKK
jgi:hypothetical protein